MIVREVSNVTTVEWGNGLSRRLLLDADGMGYTLTDTTVRPGTKSKLEYRAHLEACYCIEGEGEIVDAQGNSYRLEPGVMYALDKHDPHYLIAGPEENLRLVCVFVPALTGAERHHLDSDEFSHY